MHNDKELVSVAELNKLKSEMLLLCNQLYADDIAQKKTRLESTPIHINLEITNRCNLSCPTCARNYWDKEKKQ